MLMNIQQIVVHNCSNDIYQKDINAGITKHQLCIKKAKIIGVFQKFSRLLKCESLVLLCLHVKICQQQSISFQRSKEKVCWTVVVS